MPKWDVYGTVVGGKYLGKFEAATKEEAEAIALEKAGYAYFCHHCEGECENAEVTEATAELIED